MTCEDKFYAKKHKDMQLSSYTIISIYVSMNGLKFVGSGSHNHPLINTKCQYLFIKD